MSIDMTCKVYLCVAAFMITTAHAFYKYKSFECGPYGFVCEGNSKLRLCEGEDLFGPTFICPAGTICNEDSSSVCDDISNYIDPTISRTVRCRRNERIADPSVAACKGYILCIPNKNRFQGIKFQCGGNTIFNGYTRTCTSPDKYKCPLTNTTKSSTELYGDSNRRRTGAIGFDHGPIEHKIRPEIDCKDYKFTVTNNQSPVRATYFCPQRAVRGEPLVRCTVFSNNFCITLAREEQDQFVEKSSQAYRRPRKYEKTNDAITYRHFN